jgi:hypothetical protein
MGLGVKVGPLYAGTSWRQLGCGPLFAFLLVIVFGIWPYLLLSDSNRALAWLAEIAWLCVLIGVPVAVAISNGKKAAERRQQVAEAQRLLAERRVAMRATNAPWFDPGLRCYTHSTCSIRHRTEGAASRCKSKV